MKLLDLDMDYFMENIATGIAESKEERLSEEEYGDYVWSEQRVRDFLENNLGLSKDKKIKGRIVAGHNEALFFWQELIENKSLETPFEVVHVDSHADLGLGYLSWTHIMDYMLQYSVEERLIHTKYVDCFGKLNDVGIGDYLLYAIAFRWISKLTYCANPEGDKNDYVWETLKDFEEKYIWDKSVENTIQLVCNPDMDFPSYDASEQEKQEYLKNGVKELEIEDVLHIHGGVSSVCDIPPIMGHCNKRDIQQHRLWAKEADEVYSEAEASVLDAVADYLEDIYKDTRERIFLNQYFFESLHSVNHVVVIGWSAGDVDIPYLQEVISKVDKSTTWTVYWYDDIAYNSLQKAFKKEGITDKKKIHYIQSSEFWDK